MQNPKIILFSKLDVMTLEARLEAFDADFIGLNLAIAWSEWTGSSLPNLQLGPPCELFQFVPVVLKDNFVLWHPF